MTTTNGKYSVPEEIRRFKPRGTMVKNIAGNYYVYEYKATTKDNTRKTQMGALIGKITMEDGFVPNGSKIKVSENTCLEYGQYAIVVENTKGTFNLLKDTFNIIDAKQIYTMAILHVVNGYTGLSSLKSLYDQSYLSQLFKGLALGYQASANLLDNLGRKQQYVNEFQQNLIDLSSKEMAIDGHCIATSSEENELSEYGNKYGRFKSKQINVLMAYDINTQMPLASRVYGESELDKSSIKDFLSTFTAEGVLFVIDRSFYSDENIGLFSSNGNKYIIPLSRNLKSYKAITQDMTLPEYFIYEVSDRKRSTRKIEYKFILDGDTFIYVFKDLDKSISDEASYLADIERGKKDCTIEEYNKIKDFFGVIVLQTNYPAPPKEVYMKYKGRWKIETFYDYLKNGVEFTTLVTQDYYKTQGLSFLMLIVGLLHRELKNATLSVKGKTLTEILIQAKAVKMVLRNHKWEASIVSSSLVKTFEEMNIILKKNIDF